jgi:hypothetical protein
MSPRIAAWFAAAACAAVYNFRAISERGTGAWVSLASGKNNAASRAEAQSTRWPKMRARPWWAHDGRVGPARASLARLISGGRVKTEWEGSLNRPKEGGGWQHRQEGNMSHAALSTHSKTLFYNWAQSPVCHGYNEHCTSPAEGHHRPGTRWCDWGSRWPRGPRQWNPRQNMMQRYEQSWYQETSSRDSVRSIVGSSGGGKEWVRKGGGWSHLIFWRPGGSRESKKGPCGCSRGLWKTRRTVISNQYWY